MALFEKELVALRNKLDELGIAWNEDTMSAAKASQEVGAIKEWLSENKKIAKLTELIPQSKKADGGLAYITKGQYRKHWRREPKDVILTTDGKRVRWEYALDELAGELGLDDGEAVKDMIVLVEEYKERKHDLEHSLSVAEDDIDAARGKLEKVTIHIGKRELVSDKQEDRSEHAQIIDDSKQARSVLAFPNVDKWMHKPGRHDIRGVDMLKRREKSKPSPPRTSRVR